LRGAWPKALLVAFFLLSPATLTHFGAVVVQPDSLLFCLTLLAYAALVRLPGWVGPVLAAAPCVVAILVHEAFVFLLYPVVLAILLDRWRTRKISAGSAMVHFGLVLSAFVLVMALGRSKIPDMQLFQESQARTAVPISDAAFHVVSRGLSGQLREVAALYSLKVLMFPLVSTLLLAPYLLYVWKSLRRLNEARAVPFPLPLLIAMPVIPLLLSILGVDLFRWFAGAITVCLLFALYLMETAEAPVGETLGSFPLAYGAGIAIYGLAIGPLGAGGLSILGHVVTILWTGRS